MKKSHSTLSKNKPVCTCREGWCVGLGQEGVSLRESVGNCLKYFKQGEIEKRGVETKT